MKKSACLLLVVTALVVSCKDEEEPQRIFWVQLSNLVGTEYSEDWVIIRDQATGEVLGSNPMESGEYYEFETTQALPQTISVTYFRKERDGTVDKYTADTYTDVPVASVWYINPFYDLSGGAGIQPGATVGTYDLTVNDVPSIYTMGLSDNRGVNYSSSNFTGNTLTAKGMKIREGSPLHLLCIDPGTSTPKYIMIADLVDSQDRMISYSSFNDFDKVIKITFPATKNVTFESRGFEDGLSLGSYFSYEILDNLPVDDRTEKTFVNLCFLSTIPNYKIDLNIADNFIYSMRGPAPETFDYISPSVFNITDRSLSGFKTSTQQVFTYSIADFGYSDVNNEVHFNYYSSPGNENFYDALPPEILGAHPAISISKVALQSCIFTVRGQTYDHLRSEKFGESVMPGVVGVYERLQVVVK